ncbi:MAG: tetratricopeptide repeat protein [Elusimicrobiales bacterium]|nr:tetratricopeptide repeat protein [Elusimicrobiales bacterium]
MARPRKEFLRKLAAAGAGLLALLLLAEAGLRAGGAVLRAFQERANAAALGKKGVYRILCLGESTTQGQYPLFLEAALNQGGAGRRFAVIDEGKGATDTAAILARAEALLDKYRPDMVVAMMGMNDPGEPHLLYEEPSGGAALSAVRSLKVYKLARLLYRLSRGENSWALPGREGPAVDRHGASSGPGWRTPQEAAEAGRLERTAAGQPDALVRLGTLYLRQGLALKAEEALRAALELRPDDYAALVGLGWTSLELADLEAAGELFQKARRLKPDKDGAYAGLGALSVLKGDARGAEKNLLKALELNPANGKACSLLGGLYAAGARPRAAEAFLERAVSLDPGSFRAYDDLARFYVESGRGERAQKVLEQAARQLPSDDRVYALLGLLRLVLDRFAEAPGDLDKALALNPANEIALLARDVLRRARTGREGAYLWLGTLCLRPGWTRPAQQQLEKAARADPSAGPPRFMLGRLYLEKGLREQARAQFEQALALNPSDERTRAALALLAGGPAAGSALPGPEEAFNKVTAANYRALKKMLDARGIRLVCVQYPMRAAAPLRNIFGGGAAGVVFVDNSGLFREAVARDGYKAYFRDLCGGDFGHCTPRGNKLLGENIAKAILAALRQP